MLGVPKGVQNRVSAVLRTVVSGGITETGWYALAVGYVDTFTGEIGRMSERQTIEVADLLREIDYSYYYPRTGAHEAIGLAVVFYMSTRQETQAEAESAPLSSRRSRTTTPSSPSRAGNRTSRCRRSGATGFGSAVGGCSWAVAGRSTN